MKITKLATDEAVLTELGERLARLRLDRNLTQQQLADEAGVSKRTVERLESGQTATQLSGFLRVCRTLDLLDRLEILIPEPQPSPIELLENHGKLRQRASQTKFDPAKPSPWTWRDAS